MFFASPFSSIDSALICHRFWNGVWFLFFYVLEMPVLALNVDEFGHRIWHHFGTKFHVFWQYSLFFDNLGGRILMDCDQKGSPTGNCWKALLWHVSNWFWYIKKKTHIHTNKPRLLSTFSKIKYRYYRRFVFRHVLLERPFFVVPMLFWCPKLANIDQT